ncbi:MAG: GlsB/YeaQ/YmgE family stress response membrane protein [Oscillospiraceae bacterium]|nr:GlsB/YeaQ/YmgE family stress response membrane protein [Oscillospiraceae bacterium]
MIGGLITGALVGWLAGKIMDSRGGLLRNIFLGVIGGAVGHFLAGLIGITGTGLGGIIISVAGACIVVYAARKLF